MIVDLERTLLRSDPVLEALFAISKRSPTLAFRLLLGSSAGGAGAAAALEQIEDLDAASLPYDQAALLRIEGERARGRPIWLVSDRFRVYALRIAEHLNLFDRVIVSGSIDADTEALRADSVREFAAVQDDRRQSSRAARLRRRIWAWRKAVRLHQWTKNVLLFVPLFASHRMRERGLALDEALAFVLFGLCASSVYLLNDLLDVSDDRHHPKKRLRPLAAGQIRAAHVLAVFPLLVAVSFLGAWWLLPPRFAAALGAYYLITLAYSLALKRVMMLDVVVLAALYTLRIVAGAYAIGGQLTFWMLAFSMFVFTSLALAKRYAELHGARFAGREAKVRGRGYFRDDLPMIASLGAASGYISVMVLALYIQDQTTTALYRHPKLIWFACPLLLFWIGRTWMLTHRGEMSEDPVVFAITDRTSIVVAVLFGLIFALAA